MLAACLTMLSPVVSSEAGTFHCWAAAATSRDRAAAPALRNELQAELIEVEPPANRYGRVFVGSPHQARGRVFKVVFAPGLADRKSVV